MQPITTAPDCAHHHFCHAICWKSILAGAITAAVTSLILLTLGSGLGLAMASPFTNDTETIASFTVKVGLWMVLMQWLSAGFGGYLAGRLRKEHIDVHHQESYFRDYAHGFLTWAVATLITVVLLTSAAASIISGGAQAGAVIGAGAAAGAGKEIAAQVDEGDGAYYIDSLFRNNSPTMAVTADDSNAEAMRIFVANMKGEEFAEADKQYLVQMVSARAGVSTEEATARVDQSIAKAQELKQEAIETADKARKASSAFSLFTAISLLAGAFIASVAATFGSSHRIRFRRA